MYQSNFDVLVTFWNAGRKDFPVPDLARAKRVIAPTRDVQKQRRLIPKRLPDQF